MMQDFRENPPKEINGLKLKSIKDYLSLKETNFINNETQKLDFDTTSNVIQFFLEDGSKISVRPSGTEPKIKFYFEIRGKLENTSDYEKTDQIAEEKINAIIEELKLK
jgi:phosphoglucomutase